MPAILALLFLPAWVVPAWLLPAWVGADDEGAWDARHAIDQTAFSDLGQSDSVNLLSRCWSIGELRGSLQDAKIQNHLAPDISGPAKADIRRAESSRAQLPGGVLGSIRWVDLDDPNSTAIALTFDLCEQANEVTGYDRDIVNYLREQGIPATFYAGGKWMRSHPERTKQLMLDPLFEVGNHAWTHGNLRFMTGQDMRDQIVWTQAQYSALRSDLVHSCDAARARMNPIPMVPQTFRFPYGACSAESLGALAEYGLAAVQWDIVTGDPSRKQTAEGIVREILRGVKQGRGSIAIMHANGRGWATANALPLVIPELLSKGVKFMTVSELLRSGTPHAEQECYEKRPGDNLKYDRLFGRGTGE